MATSKKQPSKTEEVLFRAPKQLVERIEKKAARDGSTVEKTVRQAVERVLDEDGPLDELLAGGDVDEAKLDELLALPELPDFDVESFDDPAAQAVKAECATLAGDLHRVADRLEALEVAAAGEVLALLRDPASDFVRRAKQILRGR